MTSAHRQLPKFLPICIDRLLLPCYNAFCKFASKGTVKIFAQIPLSLSEPAKTMINYSGKRDGAGNFLARGLRWAVGVVALP
jgi:hypothetical protein